MSEDRLFGIIRKNSREEVRVAARTFHGGAYKGLDIRIFKEVGFEKRQTPKGIVVDFSHIDQLIAALQRAKVSMREG